MRLSIIGLASPFLTEDQPYIFDIPTSTYFDFMESKLFGWRSGFCWALVLKHFLFSAGPDQQY